MAMRKKLTTKTIEALTPTGPKRLEVYDQLLPGFGIRVSVSGHKSWFCVVRVNNRLRRCTLGPYPRLSLSDAREAARNLMKDARAGIFTEFETDESGITLGE